MAPLKKILIAEDEKAIAEALSLKLRSSGFEVMVCSDGESCLVTAKQNPFDLIILDLIMPKKDGFSVLSELKKSNITTPVIISSNLSQEEDIKRARELGAIDYFVKSDITLASIVEKVKLTLAV